MFVYFLRHIQENGVDLGLNATEQLAVAMVFALPAQLSKMAFVHADMQSLQYYATKLDVETNLEMAHSPSKLAIISNIFGKPVKEYEEEELQQVTQKLMPSKQ